MATSTTPDRDITVLSDITDFIARFTRQLMEATRDGRMSTVEGFGLLRLASELPGIIATVHELPGELLDLSADELGQLKSIIGAELAEAIADEHIASRHIELTLVALDLLLPIVRLIRAARGIPAPAGE